MRNNSLDAVNGSAAVAFLGATIAGWTVQEWAAAAALLYSLLLIADKAWQLWQKFEAWREARKP